MLPENIALVTALVNVNKCAAININISYLLIHEEYFFAAGKTCLHLLMQNVVG